MGGRDWLEARQNCAREDRKPPSPPEGLLLEGAHPVLALLRATPHRPLPVPPPMEGKVVFTSISQRRRQTPRLSSQERETITLHPTPLPQVPQPRARGQLSDGPHNTSTCPESHHPKPLAGLEDTPCTQAPGLASALKWKPLLGCPRCSCLASTFLSFRARDKGLPQEAVPEPARPSQQRMCPASPRMHVPSHTCTRVHLCVHAHMHMWGHAHPAPVCTHAHACTQTGPLQSILSGDRDSIGPRARGWGTGTLMRRGSLRF